MSMSPVSQMGIEVDYVEAYLRDEGQFPLASSFLWPQIMYSDDVGVNSALQLQDTNIEIAHQQKQRKRKGKGGPLNSDCTYKGVRQRTWGRWVAEIRIPNKRSRLWLGTFDTAEAAAWTYDQKAKELYGESANLNLGSSNVPVTLGVKAPSSRHLPVKQLPPEARLFPIPLTLLLDTHEMLTVNNPYTDYTADSQMRQGVNNPHAEYTTDAQMSQGVTDTMDSSILASLLLPEENTAQKDFSLEDLDCLFTEDEYSAVQEHFTVEDLDWFLS